ncbi:hypothetical protein GQ53DRAFT_409044 [Thozetella sp. PMI_491]|nr:hypothetical protein GQ53DRAFT_409044 [Thozetella sp. PMI_491]
MREWAGLGRSSKTQQSASQFPEHHRPACAYITLWRSLARHTRQPEWISDPFRAGAKTGRACKSRTYPGAAVVEGIPSQIPSQANWSLLGQLTHYESAGPLGANCARRSPLDRDREGGGRREVHVSRQGVPTDESSCWGTTASLGQRSSAARCARRQLYLFPPFSLPFFFFFSDEHDSKKSDACMAQTGEAPYACQTPAPLAETAADLLVLTWPPTSTCERGGRGGDKERYLLRLLDLGVQMKIWQRARGGRDSPDRLSWPRCHSHRPKAKVDVPSSPIPLGDRRGLPQVCWKR